MDFNFHILWKLNFQFVGFLHIGRFHPDVTLEVQNKRFIISFYHFLLIRSPAWPLRCCLLNCQGVVANHLLKMRYILTLFISSTTFTLLHVKRAGTQHGKSLTNCTIWSIVGHSSKVLYPTLYSSFCLNQNVLKVWGFKLLFK